MNTEIEVKFINVNVDDIRERLKKAGAKLEQPMRLMRRAIIEMPHHEAADGFVRIRDEGDKITLTYKEHKEKTLHGARELEVRVSDFDTTVALFEAAGWPARSYQESRRETWKMNTVEVVIDEWPGLNPYIEIEGLSENEVRDTASQLGFKWENAVFGAVTSAYRAQYPNGDASRLSLIPRVVFDEPLSKIITGE